MQRRRARAFVAPNGPICATSLHDIVRSVQLWERKLRCWPSLQAEMLPRGSMLFRCALCVLAASAIATGTAAAALDPVVEAKNFSKTQERQTIYDTPEYQAQLRAGRRAERRPTRSRSRPPTPSASSLTDLCWNRERRLRRRRPPLRLGAEGLRHRRSRCCSRRATARRSRATSGRPRPGRRKRPGIVITNGSVQADEQMYWFAAQTLAKAGYVVLTFDPQGQGQSRHASARRPTRTRASPRRPTAARSSTAPRTRSTSSSRRPSTRTSRCRAARRGTSHAAKQDRRVAAGLERRLQPVLAAARPAARRPRRPLLRRRRRLLHRPVGPAREGDRRVGQPRRSPPGPTRRLAPGEQPCPADPAQRTPAPITKPALGMSADYASPPHAEHARDPEPGCAEDPTRVARLHARRASTPARSSSAAARTSTSASSRTRPSARRCAAPTRSPGTRPRGSTSTSRATRAPTRGCSPTAGATTPPRPRSTPTATATCSPSTTARGWTSTCADGRRVRLRGPARRLRRAVERRRLPRRLLLPGDRPLARPLVGRDPPLARLDAVVVDARVAAAHQPGLLVELPVLVAVAAPPLARRGRGTRTRSARRCGCPGSTTAPCAGGSRARAPTCAPGTSLIASRPWKNSSRLRHCESSV